MKGADAVLLVSFGGPERLEDVRPFLEVVLKGRPVPPERVEEVVRHYEAIGGASPLNALTRAQAAALEAELARRGSPLPVRVGMRNWHPFLAETARALAANGARRAAAVILAAHRGEAARDRYVAAVREAAGGGPEVRFAPAFFERAALIDAFAARTREALGRLPEAARSAAAWIFCAHSVPLRSPGAALYAADLRRTGALLAERFGNHAWTQAYQSRSGDPRTPWLGPDVNDAIRAAAAGGARAALLVPTGFVADHVEVLYDLDREAAATAAAAGLAFARAGTPGTHPAFIALLADLVAEA